MTRNRLIQMVSVVLVVALFTGAGFTVPVLNRQRDDLQLTNTEAGEAVSPWIALVTSALGPFRSLAVDVLWYRLMVLQEQGKYYEINTLSQFITNLYPRSAHVWLFHAWNMAYNISVATHTADERWEWVDKGIRLLREKAIPQNKKHTLLYRELSWFFTHKVGGFTDKLHWHYRRMLAGEWHWILGGLSGGDSTERVINRFRRIAEAPDTLEQLILQHPDVSRLLKELDEIGYQPDKELLLDYGWLRAIDNSIDAALFGKIPMGLRKQADIDKLLDLRDMSQADDVLRAAYRPLMAYVRKHHIINHYYMDPQYMLKLMEEYGPMDWRHPASHGVYWATLGVDRAREEIGDKHYDELNATRQRLASFQQLTRYGRIFYDPLSKDFDIMPDPRFISAYDKAFEVARDRAKSGAMTSPGGTAGGWQFDKGHENFLGQATVFAYLYGDEEEARRLYDKIRKLYDTKERPNRAYAQSLEEFIFGNLPSSTSMYAMNRAIMDAMFSRAIQEGLAHNSSKNYNRFMSLAKKHFDYMKKDWGREEKRMGERDRIGPGNYNDRVTASYIRYMTTEDIPILRRVRVWSNTPVTIKRKTYRHLRNQLRPILERAGYDLERAFPSPSRGQPKTASSTDMPQKSETSQPLTEIERQ